MRTTYALLPSLVLALPLAAQSSQHMTLLSRVPGVPCGTGDVTAFGGRYALVARRSQGFTVVDALDPANPVARDVFPPSYPRTDVRSYGCADVKTDGRYAFVSNEDFYQGNTGGFFVYDLLPDPMNPTLVIDHRPSELAGGVHNLCIDGNWLYCVSDTTSLIEVYDVTNRAAPVHVSSLGTGISNVWAHDVQIVGNRAFCSLLTGGFAIYDVTNPGSPVLLAQRTYANPFTHNAWPSKDGSYLYTTDENIVGGVGGAVRIWDIRNLANVQQVGSYKIGAPSSIVHNVLVVDDLLFVAYYKEGVRVASLQSDPTIPVEIAHYDTFPAAQTPCFPNSNYAGCWGAAPLNPDVLLASDLDNGLFLLRLHPLTQTLSATPNPAPAGQPLQVTLQYTNASAGVVDGAGVLVATRIGPVPVATPLAIDFGTMAPNAQRSAVFAVTVPPGLPPGLVIEVTGISALLSPHLLLVSDRGTLPVTLQ